MTDEEETPEKLRRVARATLDELDDRIAGHQAAIADLRQRREIVHEAILRLVEIDGGAE